MLNAISVLSALGVAILLHFLHPVRHNEAIADLPRSKCSMGPKMAKKLEFRGICSLNFYYINLVFPIFRICPIMSQFQFIYKTWYFYMGYEMGKHLTSHKSAHSFFFRKKSRSVKSKKEESPDAKFQIFGVRFWKRTALRRVIWSNFKVFLKFSVIWTF